MLSIVNFLLSALAIVLLIPIAVLFIECIAALWPLPQLRASSSTRPRIAVLIPAHNESIEIRRTIEVLRPQLTNSDQLLVVADNCTDDTAAIARDCGATVIERYSDERGKGYALDFGLSALASHPPDVVVTVDADCYVHDGAIDQIARQAAATGRPVQSLYLMEQPARSSSKDAISALAFLVKNLVRPAGLAQLGLPCGLTGTGMAFPWQTIRGAALASGNIVEDMQLGLDLAIAQSPPQFCPSAQVTGRLPQASQAAKTQRTRWEHGHIQTLVKQVPRLLREAVRQQRFDLLAIALDLSVPPLSLLVMLWAASFGLAVIAAGLGASNQPAIALGIGGGLILLAIVSAWAKHGRTTISGRTLLAVPFYVLWKIPLYLALLVRPQTQWVRTEREADSLKP